MIYLDTNVLVYAFCNNVDDAEQKEKSQIVLKNAILAGELILSEIVLYEFAFVCKKLQESDEAISENLEFLSKYVKTADIYSKVKKFMNKTSAYNQSFDAYHVCFSEYFDCKLITFDKGFKNFQSFIKTDIEIV